MDATRRLATTLHNLTASARDAAVLSTALQTEAALDAAKSAALVTRLDAAQKAATALPRRRQQEI